MEEEIVTRIAATIAVGRPITEGRAKAIAKEAYMLFDALVEEAKARKELAAEEKKKPK